MWLLEPSHSGAKAPRSWLAADMVVGETAGTPVALHFRMASDTPSTLSRRTFVGTVAIGGVAAAAGCNGSVDNEPGPDGGGPDGRTDTGTPPDGAQPDAPMGNQAPVWSSVPTVQFVAGVASTFSIAPYVTDPDGDDLTITLNDVPLPAGVTYDAVARELVYDGSGPVAMTTGHVLTADDGQP